MTKKMLALGCAVLAVLVLSAALSPADARRGGRGFSKSFGPKFHGRFSGPKLRIGPRFHRSSPYVYRRYRSYPHIYVAPPLIYGSYYYAECNWLRRRALRTGSPYWWERYYACIDEDY
jgi:hypothetical protein